MSSDLNHFSSYLLLFDSLVILVNYRFIRFASFASSITDNDATRAYLGVRCVQFRFICLVATQEARPSPERLDAQIRQLIHSKDSIIQTLMDQNKALMDSNKVLCESNKALMSKMDDMKTEIIADFRKETQRQRAQQSISNHNIQEDLYPYGEEEYQDYNYPNTTAQSGGQGVSKISKRVITNISTITDRAKYIKNKRVIILQNHFVCRQVHM